MEQDRPGYFEELARQQAPEYLWIGCSDSRVAANTILDLLPGEVFVHRNIANVVNNTDLNCLSVMQFAVEVLGVGHIMVCGHYGCGGVIAALEDKDHGLIDNWLQPIRAVAAANRAQLEALGSAERQNLLCELNVKQQVKNVCGTDIVQNAWQNGNPLIVHGLIYNIGSGILERLESHGPAGHNMESS